MYPGILFAVILFSSELFSWLTEKVRRLPTCFVMPSPPYNQYRIIVPKLESMLLLLGISVSVVDGQ